MTIKSRLQVSMSNVKAVLGRKFSECSRKRANNGGIRGKAKSLNFDFATPKRSSLCRTAFFHGCFLFRQNVCGRLECRSVKGFACGCGYILPFFIDFNRCPYNTIVLPCESVIVAVVKPKDDDMHHQFAEDTELLIALKESSTQKSAKSHARNVIVIRDLDLGPLNPKTNGFYGSFWNISTPGLVILTASVF